MIRLFHLLVSEKHEGIMRCTSPVLHSSVLQTYQKSCAVPLHTTRWTLPTFLGLGRPLIPSIGASFG